jgi:hypothetical protein
LCRVAAFQQEEFETALKAFEEAQEKKPTNQHKLWIRKAQAELEESDFKWS